MMISIILFVSAFVLLITTVVAMSRSLEHTADSVEALAEQAARRADEALMMANAVNAQLDSLIKGARNHTQDLRDISMLFVKINDCMRLVEAMFLDKKPEAKANGHVKKELIKNVKGKLKELSQ